MSYNYSQIKHIPVAVKEQIAKILINGSKNLFQAQGMVTITPNPQLLLRVSIPATVHGFDITKYLSAGEFVKTEERGANSFVITGASNIAKFLKNLGCVDHVYAVLNKTVATPISVAATPVVAVKENEKPLPRENVIVPKPGKVLTQSAAVAKPLQQLAVSQQMAVSKPSAASQVLTIKPTQHQALNAKPASVSKPIASVPVKVESYTEFAKKIAWEIRDFTTEYKESHKGSFGGLFCQLPTYVEKLQQAAEKYFTGKYVNLYYFRLDCYMHVQEGLQCKNDCKDSGVRSFFESINTEICKHMSSTIDESCKL
jgi:hypothetical protein